MVWSVVGSGLGKVRTWSYGRIGGLASTEGRMMAASYNDILSNHLVPFVYDLGVGVLDNVF